MIDYKSPAELDKMRRAGRIVAGTIDRVLAAVKPGVTTGELDRVAEDYIRDAGRDPVVQGLPGHVPRVDLHVPERRDRPRIPSPKRVVKSGDILSLDFGAIWDGFHGDAAVTVIVDEPPSAEAEKLVRVTEDALEAGISQIRPGGRLSDIGAAVQAVAEGAGFSVVREYVGHGIGRDMHEKPDVPNYGEPGRGLAMKPGLVIAVEPMVNLGGWETRVLADDWTVVTEDGSLSAHFEHTIAVTEGGREILTARG